MPKSDLPPFVIAVDTREQAPLDFLGFACMRKSLLTGDYSIVGHETQISIERKSYFDAWGSVAEQRPRFERCIKRLAELPYRALVIECTLKQLEVQPRQVERVQPSTCVGSYISWSVQYNIPVWLCEDRIYAARVVLRILSSYWKHVGSKQEIGR